MVLLVVWAVTVLVGHTPWAPNAGWLGRNPAGWNRWTSTTLFAAPMIAIVGHGVVVGWRKAHKLRPYKRAVKPAETVEDPPGDAGGDLDPSSGEVRKDDPNAEKRKAARARGALSDPAGLAIAWSVVYGIVYVTLATAIFVAHSADMQWWDGAAAVLSLVLGWMFSVVFVYLIFWNRERRLVRKLAAVIASARREASSKVTDAEALQYLKKGWRGIGLPDHS